jgi:hypothetical protein
LRRLPTSTPTRSTSRAIAANDAVSYEVNQAAAKENRDDDLQLLQNPVGTFHKVVELDRHLIRQRTVRISKPKSAPSAIDLFSDSVLVAVTCRKPFQVLTFVPILDFARAQRSSISVFTYARVDSMIKAPFALSHILDVTGSLLLSMPELKITFTTCLCHSSSSAL